MKLIPILLYMYVQTHHLPEAGVLVPEFSRLRA
jgi:hypothetical protein